MDGGAWWATVRVAEKSQTRLSTQYLASIYVHLGYFQFLAIMNKAVMNTCIQIFVGNMSSFYA